VAGLGAVGFSLSWNFPLSGATEKPATNIRQALEYPRTAQSLPGRYPGQVVEVVHSQSVKGRRPQKEIIRQMLDTALRELTGEDSVPKAWRQFVAPEEVVGLKVNPVAGKLLSTSRELVQVVIEQLTAAGIPRKHIVIWDRREFELHEVGFTPENFPGVRIMGTERKDADGSFYDKSGKLYGEAMIDREWYYYADCQMKYDAETLPYMVNEGKYSYFSKIVTREVDKIINLPILKNAGASITLCLKNLAYGSISNTARLHQQLWSETCAQVPCFPPLRDKVVLNIADGLIGCYEGGPGANPNYIVPFHRILVGTDPVAVDRIGYEFIQKKRRETKIQQKESPAGRRFLELAHQYGLGESRLEKIQHQVVQLG
jgi:uncharacterized protein (DUF362 family)